MRPTASLAEPPSVEIFMARKRSVAKELVSLLQTSPRPVYVLDDRRRIVFCNDACCVWLGTSPEHLIGQQCNYRGRSVAPGDLAAALCPPPEVFTGESVTTEVVCLDRQQQSIATDRDIFSARHRPTGSGRRDCRDRNIRSAATSGVLVRSKTNRYINDCSRSHFRSGFRFERNDWLEKAKPSRASGIRLV